MRNYNFTKFNKCTLSIKFSSYSAALTLPLLNYIRVPLIIAANEISQKSDFNKFSLTLQRQFYKIKKCTL